MQAYLLDDFKVDIDPVSAQIGGCFQGHFVNGIPSAWGADELRFFYNRTLKYDNCVMLDIGANTGSFSMLAKRHPNLTSHAFEPNPETFEILNNNVSLNDLNDKIKTYQVALSDNKGTAILKIPTSGTDCGFASIGQPKRFDHWRELEIQTRTLDDFAYENNIGKVDLIKIDTEGCELFVLKGGEEFIKRHRPNIFTECDQRCTCQFGYDIEEMIDLLTSWGYQYAKISHEDLFFYIPSETVCRVRPHVMRNRQKIKDDAEKSFMPDMSETDFVVIDKTTPRSINSHDNNAGSEDDAKVMILSGTLPRFNGGVKIYNLWIKLLQANNIHAYIATQDGGYDPWLCDHQPVISYRDLNYLKETNNIRIMTGWLDTPQLEQVSADQPFYYFDAELTWTLKFRNKLDYFLKTNRIAKIATHSRYIQSWYMANYGIKPVLINEFSDTSIFYDDAAKRIPLRIGCMPEPNEKDETAFNYLHEKVKQFGNRTELIKITGDEKEVAGRMQTVDIFVGLNQGKHELWGEGCPRTQQEALHCGCVLVAFDCLGNREYLYHNWTGLMAPAGDKEKLWSNVNYLLDHEAEKERLRINGKLIADNLFSEKNKIALIGAFLDLHENKSQKLLSKQQLTELLPKPFWLGEEEVPFLSQLASTIKGTIVEIGCAFGGSSTVILLNKPQGTKVVSIDPFEPDSKGGVQANEADCRMAVTTALRQCGKQQSLDDWHLISGYSYHVVNAWNQPIDLLFIDGSHHYEDVKQDFLQWSRYVKTGGLILFHDSRKDNIAEDPGDKKFSRGWLGPTRFVEELKDSRDYELTDTCYSISVFKRK